MILTSNIFVFDEYLVCKGYLCYSNWGHLFCNSLYISFHEIALELRLIRIYIPYFES